MNRVGRGFAWEKREVEGRGGFGVGERSRVRGGRG